MVSGKRGDRLRAINVPQRIKVQLDAAGRPVAADGCLVESICETWRIDDEWWRHSITRRYIEVTLVGGKHVVLFEDLTTGEWWMQQP